MAQTRDGLASAEQALLKQADAPTDSEHATPAELASPDARAVPEEPEVAEEAGYHEAPPEKADFFSAPARAVETGQEFQPTSFIDQCDSFTAEDAEVDYEQPDTSTPLPAQAAASEPLSAPPPDSSDDKVLEEYMENMMQRMHATSGSVVTNPTQIADSASKRKKASTPFATGDQGARPTSAADKAAKQPPVREPMNMESLKKSSHKPALPMDLAAMRELANSSARGAIAKHHRRRHLERALGSSLVFLIATGVGVSMMLKTLNYHDPYFGGGCIFVAIGVVGGSSLLGFLMRAIREGSWERTAPTEIASETHSNANSSAAELPVNPAAELLVERTVDAAAEPVVGPVVELAVNAAADPPVELAVEPPDEK